MPSTAEYRAWLLSLPKAQLADLVIESRAVADFLRGQFQYAERESEILKAQGDGIANDRARRGGFLRAYRSPKHRAKLDAYVLWMERHEGKRPDLRTVAQFADEVMRRHPELTSHKVVCGWSAKWTKHETTRKSPTS